jgi:hypothetical protein
VAKVSPRNLKHLASESINVLELYDETREKAVYYAQFSWEEVCRKRGGGPFTVPQDKVYKTTKGEASDLEGLTNDLAHKSVLSACYLVMLVVHMVGRVATSTCGLGFMGEYWEHSLGSVVSYGAGRTGRGLLGFLGVGLVGGLFGVGAGGRFQRSTWRWGSRSRRLRRM